MYAHAHSHTYIYTHTHTYICIYKKNIKKIVFVNRWQVEVGFLLFLASVITAFKMFHGCFNAFSNTAKQIHRIFNMWIHSIGLISVLKKIILVIRKKGGPHSVSYICSRNINRYNHGNNIKLHFSMHNLIRFEIVVSRSMFKVIYVHGNDQTPFLTPLNSKIYIMQW